jgi:2-succinyl-6-hydroxy-2,4-cyclohexadiene-1-carboxylate synthase
MRSLVLLHGFAQTGASWHPVALALPTRYRAIMPDLPGSGALAERRPVSWAAVTAYVDALAPSAPYALAGYSMGGRVALHLAVRRPQRIRALALIGATPGIEDAEQRAARRASDEELAASIEASGVEPFAEAWEAQPLFAGRPAHVAAAARAQRLAQSPAGLAATLRGLGTGTMEPPLWDRLATLPIQVALVVGERDDKFRAIAERMAAAIPRASLHVIEDAGHAAHLEAPEAVAAILASLP